MTPIVRRVHALDSSPPRFQQIKIRAAKGVHQRIALFLRLFAISMGTITRDINSSTRFFMQIIFFQRLTTKLIRPTCDSDLSRIELKSMGNGQKGVLKNDDLTHQVATSEPLNSTRTIKKNDEY